MYGGDLYAILQGTNWTVTKWFHPNPIIDLVKCNHIPSASTKQQATDERFHPSHWHSNDKFLNLWIIRRIRVQDKIKTSSSKIAFNPLNTNDVTATSPRKTSPHNKSPAVTTSLLRFYTIYVKAMCMIKLLSTFIFVSKISY